jgi:site-specific recombinase XerD
MRRACKKARSNGLKRGKSAPVRDWFMIELGLFSGLRVQEMANLKCGDFHINNEQCSLSVRKGKGNKSRTVRLKEECKDECLWFFEWKKTIGQDIGSEAHLLTTNKGTPLTKRSLQKAFKRCAKRAGIESHYSIHCLRHTYGSHLYKASNHNLRLVQEQLGHSSVRTTEIYTSLMDTDAKEAAEKLYEE